MAGKKTTVANEDNFITFSAKTPRPVTVKGVTSVFVALVATEINPEAFEISRTDTGATFLSYTGDESLLRVKAADVAAKVKEYLDSW